MKKILIIAFGLLLMGCKYMSNENIVKKTTFCNENGFSILRTISEDDKRITHIQCLPLSVEKEEYAYTTGIYEGMLKNQDPKIISLWHFCDSYWGGFGKNDICHFLKEKQ